jgi:predicted TIM-barrel fold metal-dependent hydrolase
VTQLEVPIDVPIIDVDAHVSEPPDLWTSRVAARWRDAVPRVEWDDTAGEARWVVGGLRMHGVGYFAQAGWQEPYPSYPGTLEEADPASWEPHARLARMDEHGVAAQVLYANLLGFDVHALLVELGPELALECVRIYNDYLVEFASVDPSRLVPLMNLPFWDLDAAVAELERCVATGHRGVVLAAHYDKIGYPNLARPEWARVLEAAQHHELSVNFHIGFSQLSLEAVSQQWDTRTKAARASTPPDLARFVGLSATSFLGNAQAISDVIVTGLCHRYPRLRFVSVESGFGYVPFLLQALDWQWEQTGAIKQNPGRLRPSEYFRRQVFATFWFERVASEHVEAFADNLMFETDFPHPTSLSPGPHSPALPAREVVRQHLGGLTPTTRRQVLHDNAAALYHLT